MGDEKGWDPEGLTSSFEGLVAISIDARILKKFDALG